MCIRDSIYIYLYRCRTIFYAAFKCQRCRFTSRSYFNSNKHQVWMSYEHSFSVFSCDHLLKFEIVVKSHKKVNSFENFTNFYKYQLTPMDPRDDGWRPRCTQHGAGRRVWSTVNDRRRLWRQLPRPPSSAWLSAIQRTLINNNLCRYRVRQCDGLDIVTTYRPCIARIAISDVL